MKNKINLIIDIAMMLVMMAVAGIGLMLKYILLAGYKVNEIYGQHVDLKFANLGRHEWGNIHLLLGYVLLGLLVLHLIFHIKMIACLWRKMFKNKIVSRFLALCLVIIFCVLLLGPLFITPEVSSRAKFSNQNFRRNTAIESLSKQQQIDLNLKIDASDVHKRKHKNRRSTQ